jgi:NADPH2:quinone reductase
MLFAMPLIAIVFRSSLKRVDILGIFFYYRDSAHNSFLALIFKLYRFQFCSIKKSKGVSMKTIQMNRFGGPEVLEIQEVAIGKPGKGQALINIKAAGVNFIDIYQRRGTYPVKLPYVPGLEASGIVEAVGEGVTEFKAGDRVAYVHKPGSYAEQSLVDANDLILLPKELSFEQGAAFPLQGMTAHYLLHEFRKVKKGDVVLIHAAAGGMGLLLTQWANHLGARVIGTVSTPEKAKI